MSKRKTKIHLINLWDDNQPLCGLHYSPEIERLDIGKFNIEQLFQGEHGIKIKNTMLEHPDICKNCLASYNKKK